MTSSASHRVNTAIALSFVMAVILLGVWTLSQGEWRGALLDEHQTWIIYLPKQPVWDPPEMPKYSDFWKFDNVPTQRLAGTRIAIDLNWEFMVITFLIDLWYLVGFFAVVTLFSPKENRNLGISLIRALAVSLSGAAIGCIGLWTLVGGWGPPLPLGFGLLGVLIGIGVGIVNGSRQEKTGRQPMDSQAI